MNVSCFWGIFEIVWGRNCRGCGGQGVRFEAAFLGLAGWGGLYVFNRFCFFWTQKMRLIGIEPTHAAPEATALSTELQTHYIYHTTTLLRMQEEILKIPRIQSTPTCGKCTNPHNPCFNVCLCAG